MTKPRAYTVCAIGDAHDAPKIAKDRFRWMGRYAADRKVDKIVQIGDFATFDSLNTHEGNDTLGGRLKGVYLDDINSYVEALAQFDKGLGNWSGTKHITGGNHERRLFSLENRNPEVAGLLAERYEAVTSGATWTTSPYGAIHRIGGVGFVHAAINRMGKTFGGVTAEQQIANQSNSDLVVGHSHVAKIHTAAKIGEEFVRVVNLGCALPQDFVEAYARHTQTGWTWGIWTLGIWDGHIQDWEFVSMRQLEARYGGKK